MDKTTDQALVEAIQALSTLGKPIYALAEQVRLLTDELKTAGTARDSDQQ